LSPCSLDELHTVLKNTKASRQARLKYCELFKEIKMGNKIITEADRVRTPAPKPLPGTTLATPGRGQKVSLERGVATRSKKNPGKRSKKGG
jgi:hypothetical protein